MERTRLESEGRLRHCSKTPIAAALLAEGRPQAARYSPWLLPTMAESCPLAEPQEASEE